MENKVKYQGCIVRYEKNPRPAFEGDEWEFPSFLGFDEDNNFCWYGCTYEDLRAKGKLHNAFYLDIQDFHEARTFEERVSNEMQQRNFIKDIFLSLAAQGLLPRSEDFNGNHYEYKYVLEGYRVEHYVIKELLGIDNAETCADLTQEQFSELEKIMGKQWKKYQETTKFDDFINLNYLDRVTRRY